MGRIHTVQLNRHESQFDTWSVAFPAQEYGICRSREVQRSVWNFHTAMLRDVCRQAPLFLRGLTHAGAGSRCGRILRVCFDQQPAAHPGEPT